MSDGSRLMATALGLLLMMLVVSCFFIFLNLTTGGSANVTLTFASVAVLSVLGIVLCLYLFRRRG